MLKIMLMPFAFIGDVIRLGDAVMRAGPAAAINSHPGYIVVPSEGCGVILAQLILH